MERRDPSTNSWNFTESACAFLKGLSLLSTLPSNNWFQEAQVIFPQRMIKHETIIFPVNVERASWPHSNWVTLVLGQHQLPQTQRSLWVPRASQHLALGTQEHPEQATEIIWVSCRGGMVPDSTSSPSLQRQVSSAEVSISALKGALLPMVRTDSSDLQHKSLTGLSVFRCKTPGRWWRHL